MIWHLVRSRCAAVRAAAFSLIVAGGWLAPLCASPPLPEPQTIVFDDLVGPGNPTATGLQAGAWFFASQQFHTVSLSDAGLLGFANNGTPYIASVGGGLDFPIVLERNDGHPFSLVGFDAAEGFLDDIAAAEQGFASATQVEVAATLAGGSTLALTFDLDGLRDGPAGVDDFQPFAMTTELQNVTSVTFTGLAADRRDAAFALDNIVVAYVVPEPRGLELAQWAVVAFLFCWVKPRCRHVAGSVVIALGRGHRTSA